MLRLSLVLFGATAIAAAQDGIAARQVAPQGALQVAPQVGPVITQAAGQIGLAAPQGTPGAVLINSKNSGGGSPCAVACQSANTACTTPWGAGNTNTFALQLTAPAAGETIYGFSLGTKNVAASSVACYVYNAVAPGGVPMYPAVATGTMAVGTTYGLYSVSFATPPTIAGGATFYIAFDNGGMEHPICSAGGTPTTYAWHPPGSNPPWNSFFTQAWR